MLQLSLLIFEQHGENEDYAQKGEGGKNSLADPGRKGPASQYGQTGKR